MSVKLIDNDAFYGFRVRRTVNGKLFQEYFSLKQNGKRLGPRLLKRVEGEASARDHELESQQCKWKKKHKADLCFHPDGSVKGISYLLKKEKSGNLTPIFQVGIASEIESKIVCTSYSLHAHGKQEAWQQAVATYAKHKKIAKNSKLYKHLLEGMPSTLQEDARS